MDLLITGFQPFLNYSINPTGKIVKLLDLIDMTVHKAILPCDFKLVEPIYDELLATHQPKLIINLGLSAKAVGLNLETIALNVAKDFLKAPGIIDKSSEMALKTTIDTFQMAQRLRDSGIPARASNHAGDYLCNYIFYKSLKYTQNKGGQALFIHMPFTSDIAASIYSDEQQAFPSLATDMVLKGIELIVQQLHPKKILS